MRKHINCFLSLIMLLVMIACNNKKQQVQQFDEKPVLLHQYNCNAEKIKNPKSKNPQFGTASSGLFNGVNQRTSTFAFGGKHSLMVNNEFPYAFGTKIEVEANNFVEVSIWRMKCEDCGTLVIKQDEKELLTSTYTVIQETKKWEKLLATALVIGDPTKPHILNIFYTNHSTDTTYVDQIQIDVFNKLVYPNFPELKRLEISIDKKDFLKLKAATVDAKKLDIILPEHKKKYKAKINANGKLVDAKIRLKGDWVDHLENDKWSFRIEISGDESVFGGLKEFSIQNPKTRHFIEEYAFHNLADSLHLLTTRYGFIQVVVNGKNLGIYAYEEHFTKQLIESRKRREGPIVKFDEEPFWNQNRYNKSQTEKISTPYYQAAQVLPYDYKKTTETPALFAQFNQANILMNQYKYGLADGSQIMDVVPFTMATALSDLGQVGHSYAWHNQRFYYNPVINKLEPILYDCYTDYWHDGKQRNIFYPITNNHKSFKGKPENIVTSLSFRDPIIQQAYANAVHYLTHAKDVKKLIRAVCAEAKFYEPFIQREFKGYSFQYESILLTHLEVLKTKSDSILSHLSAQNFATISPPFSDTSVFIEGTGLVVHYDDQNKMLELTNFHNGPLTILGTKQKKQKPVPFQTPINIAAFNVANNEPGSITIPYGELKQATLYYIGDDNVQRESEIYSWPTFKNQATALQTYHASSKVFIPHTASNDTIWVTPGNHVLDKPLVIPLGKTLMLDAGTTIDLINRAKIICFGAIHINGNQLNPVQFNSSDKTGEGLVVLQAPTKSFLNHVVFDGLNTIQDRFWTLTGAVTFYESDVVMNHVTVKNNPCEDALNIIRSHFEIKNLSISGTASDGFDADYCTGILDSSEFINTGNDCIDFSTSEITISNILISNSGDKGISGGEASTLDISNVVINGAVIGIAAKDKSQLLVKNITINDAIYGLAAFQKKPEYGPAHITATQITLNNIKNKYILEKNSSINWDGKLLFGNKKLDLEQLYEL